MDELSKLTILREKLKLRLERVSEIVEIDTLNKSSLTKTGFYHFGYNSGMKRAIENMIDEIDDIIYSIEKRNVERLEEMEKYNG
ncbi:hypothetical protein U729_3258 (plasmid) [Clostridium baratii str. Sullivan]|uniref:Phage protein n=1 Tax=Clostridium baratii str. Sullivan TaxID=1415775 RepID=A0A0A7G0K2_9CLOT|nr:hypothetical protein [Clostridium baratii]AIY85404.1 hypothetical protein U729_3258 [Clostridium baratii str. Sullivan]